MLGKKDAIAGGLFQNYINKAANTDVVTALQQNTGAFTKFLAAIPPVKIDHAYAEGKWTIKELLQHIIDAERVFAYRALRLGRMDATPLPGFDENHWAVVANKAYREWDNLLSEFTAVRSSTTILFDNLGEQELVFTGTASNLPVNALAMGYVIAGHAQHHIDVIRERYL